MRALGPDEDAFTLVAAVVEATGAVDPSAPRTIRLLGDAADVADDDLRAFVGASAEPIRSDGGAADFRSAVASSASGEDGSELVVVASVGGVGGRPAGAVALWFVPGAGPAAPSSTSGDGEDALGGAVRYLSGLPDGSTVWVGPWDDPDGNGRPAGDWDPAASAPSSVSEGAYVPRPRYLESRASRWRFVAERCGACGTLTFPARGRCRACGHGDSLVAEPLSRDGGICVAVTVIGKGGQPTEFDPQVEATGPYAVALVELVPGVRATLSVADQSPESLGIGDRVATQLRRLYAVDGAWRYGRKAVPFRTGGAATRPSASPAPTGPRSTPRRSGGRGRTARRLA